jgi:hypothetical protein
MPRKVSEIVEEARQLSSAERAELVEKLILANQRDLGPKVDRAWKQMTRPRVARIKSDQAKGVPVDAALAAVGQACGIGKHVMYPRTRTLDARTKGINAAMRRATKVAAARACAFGTKLYFMRDGKIVAEDQ